jgi:DNA repair exonuclease SbcCD ATPase subunit
MKFTINKVILWNKNGKRREIPFQPNMVNIIIGDNNTGKTTILEIIDYCLLSSSARIPTTNTYDNIIWCGINFSTEENTYTIARQIHRVNVKEAYFNVNGEVPLRPSVMKTGFQAAKNKLNELFKFDLFEIDKYETYKHISFRYSLLFNLISGEISTSSEDFFDFSRLNEFVNGKQLSLNKKTDGFDTIFNLTLASENPKEKGDELKLKALEKQKKKLEKEFEKYIDGIKLAGKLAKEDDLINSDVSKTEELIDVLNKLFNEFSNEKLQPQLSQYESIKTDEIVLIRKIRQLKKFKKEYSKYLSYQNADIDVLKPIEYIYDNYKEIINNEFSRQFIENLENEYQELRSQADFEDTNVPEIENEIRELTEQLEFIQKSLNSHTYKIMNLDFHSQVGKFIQIGTIKQLFNSALEKKPSEKKSESLKRLTKEIELLVNDIPNTRMEETNKTKFVSEIKNLVAEYIQKSNSIPEYEGLFARFNYETKRIEIRSKTLGRDVSRLGGSSNQLFLRLCFFASLHEYLISFQKENTESMRTANFLIIDRLSSPFKEGTIGNNTQEELLGKAIQILNYFVERINQKTESDFQVIVLDNSSRSTVEKYTKELDRIHIVEDFRDGNALVTKEMMEYQ